MNIIGRGTKSTVYDHTDNTVLMQGNLKRDMFKLSVFAILGKLESIAIQGRFYSAIIEKMYDDRFQSDHERTMIYDIKCFVDLVSKGNDCGFTVLQKLGAALPGTMRQITDFIFDLGIDVNNCTMWVDNHDGNYLVDGAGDIVPFDLFDFEERDLSNSAKNTVKQMLADYIQ